jgi:hypothetical protein
MTHERDHTLAFLGAFYGVDTVYDFRAMHETDRSQPAKVWRGTFAQCEAAMREVNMSGPWGIHIMINETDGVVDPATGRFGLSVAHVVACRAQLLDLDDIDAAQQYERVLRSSTAPHIVVRTSPGKLQLWFKVTPHGDKQLHTDNQRRLIGEYNGDVQFIDAAHTARLPGFYHHKASPSLVTVDSGPLWYCPAHDPWAIAGALAHVPISGRSSDRQDLGHPSWQAPSLEWIAYALGRIDPNSLGRLDWIALTAATKQAGWSFGQDAVRAIWDAWCARYGRNDPRDNHKQWRSIDATAAGWGHLVKRAGIAGDLMARGLPAMSSGTVAATPTVSATLPTDTMQPATANAVQPAAVIPVGGSFVRPEEQAGYFQGCYWVTSVGRILGPNGRLMDSTRFNGAYGGKMFVLDDSGEKSTDDAWKAATRGLAWHVPKVDHMRFLPHLPFGAMVGDEFGLIGVNTYRSPVDRSKPGDVSPFLGHVARLLPDERDRAILFAFLAQCVQRPGTKVGWSVMIQSMEGAGKTIFKTIMEIALGTSYVYGPNARELGEGGGKFNGWMRNRLMMIVDEIRTDEKRELIEVMKPWITEYRIEIQNKGQDQDMGDNPTNWLMFTNYRDAIPINDKSRRFTIFYSAIQTNADMEKAGMVGRYFSDLYDWVNADGAAYVAHWLKNYPIPAEYDAVLGCTRAPRTSSTAAAIAESRGWLEQAIVDAVESGVQGFRGGWVSTIAVGRHLRDLDQRVPGGRSIAMALGSLGYSQIGKAPRVYMQEGKPYQTTLYHLQPDVDVRDYGTAQGYEHSAPETLGGVPTWTVPPVSAAAQ